MIEVDGRTGHQRPICAIVMDIRAKMPDMPPKLRNAVNSLLNVRQISESYKRISHVSNMQCIIRHDLPGCEAEKLELIATIERAKRGM